MSMNQTDVVSQIWGQIKDWPDEMRLSLATRILQSVQRPKASPRKTIVDLVGLLATSQPPPTDEEVRRIVEEERMKRYG